MGLTLIVAEKYQEADAIAKAISERPITRQFHFICSDETIVAYAKGHLYKLAEFADYDPRYADRADADILPIMPPHVKLLIEDDDRHHLETLHDLMREASVIVNACDGDREGQLIFDQIYDHCENINPKIPVMRLNTNALSRNGIKKALGEMDTNAEWKSMGVAALVRAIADQYVGINLSRMATIRWRETNGERSPQIVIGRVLTPLVGLIVARDREISEFKKTDYYTGYVVLKRPHTDEQFIATWVPPPGTRGLNKDGLLLMRDVVDAAGSRAISEQGRTTVYTCEQTIKQPPLMHNSQTLAAAANRKYGMTAAQVADAAQYLYAAKQMITYPRTNGRYLPDEAHDNALAVLHAIGKNDPSRANFVNKANIKLKSKTFNAAKLAKLAKRSDKQAIAPLAVIVDHTTLTVEQRQVYELIATQYIRQFYPPAVYESRKIDVLIGGDTFTAATETLVTAGWQSVEAMPNLPTKPNVIPPSTVGDRYFCTSATTMKSETEPPRPYTEASLMERMVNIEDLITDPVYKKRLHDAKGLGTPTTRPDIIEHSVHYEHITRTGGYLRSTDRARILTEKLPHLVVGPMMTAIMEDMATMIELGESTFPQFMNDIRPIVTAMVNEVSKSSFPKFKDTAPKRGAKTGAAGADAPRTKSRQKSP